MQADAQAYFNRLRKQYFPAHCNYLQAHLTLFHHLPAQAPLVQQALDNACCTKPFLIKVTGIANLSKGAAFLVQSNELQQLHRQLQNTLQSFLIPQDQQTLQPHITIQNKVTAFKAQQTVTYLQQQFKPFTVQAIGIQSWLYLKGPWQHVNDHPFQVTQQ